MKSSVTAELMVQIDYLQANVVCSVNSMVPASVTEVYSGVNPQDFEDLGVYKGEMEVRERIYQVSRAIHDCLEHIIITVGVKGSICGGKMQIYV